MANRPGRNRSIRTSVGVVAGLVAALALVAPASTAAASGPSPAVTSPCDQSDLQGLIDGGGDIVFGTDCHLSLTAPLTVPAGDTVSIDGSGHTVVLDGLDAQTRTRVQVFDVQGGSLSLANLTVTNGDAVGADGSTGPDGDYGGAGAPGGDAYGGLPGDDGQGGGMFVAAGATATVSDVTFSDDDAAGGIGGTGGYGGPGYCPVFFFCGSNNPSATNGGAGGDGGDGGGGQGGAIYSAGSLSVSNSTFTGDTASGGSGGTGGPGGAGGYSQTAAGCGPAGDGGDGGGGGGGGDAQGGAVYSAGPLTIQGSTFSDNSASAAAGGTANDEVNASYWDSGAIGGGVYCGTGGDGGDGGDGGHGGDAAGGSLWAAGSPAITDNTFSADSVAAGQAPADCANSPFTLGCGGVGGTAGPGGQDGSDGMDGSGGSSAGVDQYTTTVTPVSVAAGPLPDGALGVPYSSSIGISGGSGPFTWSQAGGQLPPGLTLGATTGQISGTPTSYGTYAFGIEVVDEGNPQGVPATADLAITIPPPPPEITTTSLPAGAVGVAYYQTLAAIDGTAPYTWSITSGSLPAGLTLDPAAGTITGSPTSVGASTFTVEVTDSSSPALTDSASLTIEVTPPPPQITTVELAEAQKGTAYTAKLAATGGTTPYRWSIASGSLPTGLSISATKGKITGTPTTLGTFGFDVQVTDSTSPALTATAGLSITVTKDDLTITTVSLPTGTKGSPYSAPVVASGGYAPYTWELLPGDGALPGGLHLNTSTGVISGTPTAKGSFRFAVAVTDRKRYYVPEYFTIVVAKPA